MYMAKWWQQTLLIAAYVVIIVIGMPILVVAYQTFGFWITTALIAVIVGYPILFVEPAKSVKRPKAGQG